MGAAGSVVDKGMIRRQLNKPDCYIHGHIGRQDVLYVSEQLEKKENQNVRRLRLPCRADGAEALGQLIAKNDFLRTLFVFSLNESPLGEEAFGFICKGLMANKTLTSFGMSSVPWTKSHTASLVEMIRKNTALRELRIVLSSDLKDGALDVLEAVVEAGRIESLQFACCNIDADCFRPMSNVLRRNKTLRRIDFKYNALWQEGGCLLGELLSKDATLQQVSLKMCPVEYDGMASIVNALKQNKTLCHLNLSGSYLGVEGARLLAEALAENVTLEELFVAHCSLATDGVDILVDALLHRPSLKTLDVGGNNLQSGKSIARLLANNTSLTKLDVSHGENVMFEPIIEIAEGLKENSTLKELRLRRCGLLGLAAVHLADALRGNSSLRVLDLRDNRLDAQGMEAVAEALVGNKTMTSLYILPHQTKSIKKCSTVLMKGNASLVDCRNAFEDVCLRNRAMHSKARQAVQALRVLRWRQGEESVLHMMAKEVVKMIGLALWNTRMEIAVWGKQK